MTTKQIKDKLANIADTVARNKAGNYVARRGYFFRHGQSADRFAADVAAALPGAVVLNKWDNYAAFSGAASLARSSHFGVEFRIETVTRGIPSEII